MEMKRDCWNEKVLLAWSSVNMVARYGLFMPEESKTGIACRRTLLLHGFMLPGTVRLSLRDRLVAYTRRHAVSKASTYNTHIYIMHDSCGGFYGTSELFKCPLIVD